MSRGRRLKKFLKEHKEIHKTAKWIGIAYGFVYYFSIGYITYRPVEKYNQLFARDLIGALVKLRGPFIWEPVASFEIPPFLLIQIAPLNIMVGVLLGILLYKNIVFYIISKKYPRVCQLTREKGTLWAMIPALFSGFACCAPTVIILLVGIIGTSSAALLLFFRWLLPISVMLLSYGIIQGYKSLHLYY